MCIRHRIWPCIWLRIRQFILLQLCIVFGIECCFVCDILFQFGTLCMKAEEHLWAGVVGGFHAKCTELE